MPLQTRHDDDDDDDDYPFYSTCCLCLFVVSRFCTCGLRRCVRVRTS